MLFDDLQTQANTETIKILCVEVCTLMFILTDKGIVSQEQYAAIRAETQEKFDKTQEEKKKEFIEKHDFLNQITGGK